MPITKFRKGEAIMSDQEGGTMNLWANMLGLGEVLAVAQSPDFQQQIKTFCGAIIDTQIRVARCERMLAYLVAASGTEGQAFLAQLRADGTGGPTATSRAADNGARPTQARIVG
jgi:hypothetical protein